MFKQMISIVAVAGLVLAVAAGTAQAQDFTWAGAGNNWVVSWNSPNWGGPPDVWPLYPGAREDRLTKAVFDVGTPGPLITTPYVNANVMNLYQIEFVGTGTNSFTIKTDDVAPKYLAFDARDTTATGFYVTVNSSVTTDQKFDVKLRPRIDNDPYKQHIVTFENNGSGILEFAAIQPYYASGSDIAQAIFDGSGKIEVGKLDDDGVSGAMRVTKKGAGTLTITGDNSYSGGTTVEAGTLLVNNTTGSGTGTGNVNVLSGATLGGSGTIGGATTIANGGFLAPGASIGTLTIDNLLDISGALGGSAGSMLFELGPSPSGDMVVLTGGNQLTIGSGLLEWDDFLFADLGATAGDYTLFDTEALIDGSLGSILTGTIGTLNGTLSLGDGGNDLVLTLASAGNVIPEPSTFAIASLGLLGLACFGWRKRK